MLFVALGWPPALLLRGSVRGFFIALICGAVCQIVPVKNEKMWRVMAR